MASEHLLNSTYEQWSRGYSRFIADYEYGDFPLLVAVPVTLDVEFPHIYALLDTAARWMVCPKKLVEKFELEIDMSADVKDELSTRIGKITGYLNRIPLYLIAEDGEHVYIDANCFISDDWKGPPVIGWKGCLESIKVALDPCKDLFYFANI